MYTLIIESTFKARHQLRYLDHEEPLHEHDWHVSVAVSAPKLDENELVMDFEELKLILESTLKDFRGQRLEELQVFEQLNASAEKVAFVLFSIIKPQLPDTVHLDYVEVTEAPACRARFSGYTLQGSK